MNNIIDIYPDQEVRGATSSGYAIKKS